MKAELQKRIIDFLKGEGIVAKASGSQVAVSRDSMCNSSYAGIGIPEQNTYPNVLKALQAQFDYAYCMLTWYGKTDEDLFLDNMIVNGD